MGIKLNNLHRIFYAINFFCPTCYLNSFKPFTSGCCVILKTFCLFICLSVCLCFCFFWLIYLSITSLLRQFALVLLSNRRFKSKHRCLFFYCLNILSFRRILFVRFVGWTQRDKNKREGRWFPRLASLCHNGRWNDT